MNSSLKSALDALVTERATIDQAISQIQAMLKLPAIKNGKAGPSKPGRRKPRWSPAMRKAAKERMTKYWAARRKAKK
jgi:hypothetical protein